MLFESMNKIKSKIKLHIKQNEVYAKANEFERYVMQWSKSQSY